jgi:hypothetical protein
VETIATFIARSSNNEHALCSTVSDGISEDGVGRSRRRIFATADVDDVSPSLSGL